MPLLALDSPRLRPPAAPSSPTLTLHATLLLFANSCCCSPPCFGPPHATFSTHQILGAVEDNQKTYDNTTYSVQNTPFGMEPGVFRSSVPIRTTEYNVQRRKIKHIFADDHIFGWCLFNGALAVYRVQSFLFLPLHGTRQIQTQSHVVHLSSLFLAQPPVSLGQFRFFFLVLTIRSLFDSCRLGNKKCSTGSRGGGHCEEKCIMHVDECAA